jgi:hypothetical protein
MPRLNHPTLRKRLLSIPGNQEVFKFWGIPMDETMDFLVSEGLHEDHTG